MTCIVGYKTEDGIYMGADSCGSDGHSYSRRKDKKVFFNNGYIIGFCGSFRMGQILQFDFKVPNNDLKDEDGNIVDDFEFMVRKFIPEVRKEFYNHGFMKTTGDRESGGFFLVGTPNNRLFHIESDFQVSENLENFECCGSGSDVAYGAMYTQNHLGLLSSNPQTSIEQSLRAAASIIVSVSEPFEVKFLGKDKAVRENVNQTEARQTNKPSTFAGRLFKSFTK